MNTIRHRAAWPVIVLVAALFAAACGSTTDGGESAGTTADLSKLGPENKATGEPITIGYIHEGKTATIDNTGIEAAAKAAAQYANDHLGGIKGRPVEIKFCASQGTPAGSAECANKMVNDKMPVVLGATPAAPAPIVSVLEQAGVPYFINVGVEQSAVLSPNTYVVTNTMGFLASPVVLAQQKDVKKVATLLIDVPAAVGPITALGQPLWEKAGIENNIMAIPIGTPDMTPQVQTALGAQPEMFSIVGDPGFCTAALSALNTLGFQGTRFINAQCLSPDLHTSVSGGIGGVYVGSTQSLDPNDAEVQLYHAVMASYAPEVEADATATPDGYSSVLAFIRAMNGGLEGEATPDSVKAALAAAPPQPMPLFAGQTFQCNRQLFKLTPAVCSAAISLTQMNDDGTPGTSEAIDVLPLING